MTDRIIALLILCLMFSLPFDVAAIFTGEVMSNFVLFWPLLMSALWISGRVCFWFYRERHRKWGDDTPPPTLPGNPLVFILIPCFNEGVNVRETIETTLAQRYKNIGVIAVNDGSTDGTHDVPEQLIVEYSSLRVTHLAENQGKALVLKTGTAAACSDYLVCIDGDALLDRDAVAYIVAPLIQFLCVDAVTGNPRIRTRSTLIGRMQVGKFSSIIGLIKHTQRAYGQIFIVSGVVVAFRRRALTEVGYWSPDMITEDIDISWKLQLRHWSVFSESRALCRILMPEILKGLWKQRLCWMQGGAEVFIVNMRRLWSWEFRRMWSLFLEFCFSTAWSFTCVISIVLFLLGLMIPMPDSLHIQHLFPPAFTRLILGVVCLLQFAVSLMVERRYEKDTGASLFWIIWLPVVYWTLSLFTTLVAFPKVMLKRKRGRAHWVSLDRGIGRVES